MLRNARLIITLCALTGVSVAGLVGWATGLFAEATTWISGSWINLMTWIDQPMTMNHAFAGVGAVLIPLGIMLATILVMVDR